jgi:hypothetical protein
VVYLEFHHANVLYSSVVDSGFHHVSANVVELSIYHTPVQHVNVVEPSIYNTPVEQANVMEPSMYHTPVEHANFV